MQPPTHRPCPSRPMTAGATPSRRSLCPAHSRRLMPGGASGRMTGTRSPGRVAGTRRWRAAGGAGPGRVAGTARPWTAAGSRPWMAAAAAAAGRGAAAMHPGTMAAGGAAGETVAGVTSHPGRMHPRMTGAAYRRSPGLAAPRSVLCDLMVPCASHPARPQAEGANGSVGELVRARGGGKGQTSGALSNCVGGRKDQVRQQPLHHTSLGTVRAQMLPVDVVQMCRRTQVTSCLSLF